MAPSSPTSTQADLEDICPKSVIDLQIHASWMNSEMENHYDALLRSPGKRRSLRNGARKRYTSSKETSDAEEENMFAGLGEPETSGSDVSASEPEQHKTSGQPSKRQKRLVTSAEKNSRKSLGRQPRSPDTVPTAQRRSKESKLSPNLRPSSLPTGSIGSPTQHRRSSSVETLHRAPESPHNTCTPLAGTSRAATPQETTPAPSTSSRSTPPHDGVRRRFSKFLQTSIEEVLQGDEDDAGDAGDAATALSGSQQEMQPSAPGQTLFSSAFSDGQYNFRSVDKGDLGSESPQKPVEGANKAHHFSQGPGHVPHMHKRQPSAFNFPTPTFANIGARGNSPLRSRQIIERELFKVGCYSPRQISVDERVMIIPAQNDFIREIAQAMNDRLDRQKQLLGDRSWEHVFPARDTAAPKDTSSTTIGFEPQPNESPQFEKAKVQTSINLIIKTCIEATLDFLAMYKVLDGFDSNKLRDLQAADLKFTDDLLEAVESFEKQFWKILL
ncbi:MAG: hypothetical protein M4579_003004 [Chaenotheca gracillima]|nr:MAG: hypothetical protein M4579_003004 [Chaenotheca gracillima]